MKTNRLILALVFLAALLPGCQTHSVNVEAIAPAVEAVSARHDAYVDRDPDLSPADKATFKRTTELLRKVLDEAKK